MQQTTDPPRPGSMRFLPGLKGLLCEMAGYGVPVIVVPQHPDRFV